MKSTLKSEILEAIAHYEKHAEWEMSRAARATGGSKIQEEIRRAGKYNQGRAAACLNGLELPERAERQAR